MTRKYYAIIKDNETNAILRKSRNTYTLYDAQTKAEKMLKAFNGCATATVLSESISESINGELLEQLK